MGHHGSIGISGGDPSLGFRCLRLRCLGAPHQRWPTAGGQEVLGEGRGQKTGKGR